MTDDIIVGRTLRLTSRPGSRVEVSVARPIPIDGDYICHYRIHWPDSVFEGSAMGLDSLQALLLALSHIRADLESSDAATKGDLYWVEPGDLAGLKLKF